MRTSRLFPIVALSVQLVMLGCGSGPPVRYYTLAELETHDPPAGNGEVNGRSRIGVAPFRVEPPYDQGRLVYRTDGPESPRVEYYAYHQWAAPLGRDLGRAVAGHLEQRNHDYRFERKVAGRDYLAVLEGRLIHLEELDHSTSVETRILLELELRSATGELLWLGRVGGSEEGAAKSVDQVVGLMRRALAKAIDAVYDELLVALPD